MRTALLYGLLCIGMLSAPSCDEGCVTCTGITADKKVCKDDYQEESDYTAYINQYEEEGGVCEE